MASPASSLPVISDLLDRLDRLESELAIRRLLSDYAHAADQHDLDRFLGIWHEHATWVTGEVHVGSAAIADAIVSHWRTFRQTRRYVSNVVVDFDRDPDRALCESDVSVLVQLDDGTWLRSGGTCHDVVERRAGSWKIARRDENVDFEVDELSNGTTAG